ncbi:MAG: hypothetical protein R3E60_07630, partial [Alphaproteobacteria bacterium]
MTSTILYRWIRIAITSPVVAQIVPTVRKPVAQFSVKGRKLPNVCGRETTAKIGCSGGKGGWMPRNPRLPADS